MREPALDGAASHRVDPGNPGPKAPRPSRPLPDGIVDGVVGAGGISARLDRGEVTGAEVETEAAPTAKAPPKTKKNEMATTKEETKADRSAAGTLMPSSAGAGTPSASSLKGAALSKGTLFSKPPDPRRLRTPRPSRIPVPGNPEVAIAGVEGSSVWPRYRADSPRPGLATGGIPGIGGVALGPAETGAPGPQEVPTRSAPVTESRARGAIRIPPDSGSARDGSGGNASRRERGPIFCSVQVVRFACGNQQEHGPLHFANPLGMGRQLSPRGPPLFQLHEAQPFLGQEVQVGREGAMLLPNSAPEPLGKARTFHGVPVELPCRYATTSEGPARPGGREVDGVLDREDEPAPRTQRTTYLMQEASKLPDVMEREGTEDQVRRSRWQTHTIEVEPTVADAGRVRHGGGPVQHLLSVVNPEHALGTLALGPATEPTVPAPQVHYPQPPDLRDHRPKGRPLGRGGQTESRPREPTVRVEECRVVVDGRGATSQERDPAVPDRPEVSHLRQRGRDLARCASSERRDRRSSATSPVARGPPWQREG